jgi:hypothetical protein
MRMVLFVVAAAIAAMPMGSASAAPIYRYCASYEDRGDMTCAYETFQQCLDTARGPAGGLCMENPAWHPGPPAPVPHKAKRKTG